MEFFASLDGFTLAAIVVAGYFFIFGTLAAVGAVYRDGAALLRYSRRQRRGARRAKIAARRDRIAARRRRAMARKVPARALRSH